MSKESTTFVDDKTSTYYVSSSPEDYDLQSYRRFILKFKKYPKYHYKRKFRKQMNTKISKKTSYNTKQSFESILQTDIVGSTS
jgi:hypothetical protein